LSASVLVLVVVLLGVDRWWTVVIKQYASGRPFGVVKLSGVGHAKKKPHGQCDHGQADDDQQWKDFHVSAEPQEMG